MKHVIFAELLAGALPTTSFADDLTGTTFVVTNTFEGNAGGYIAPETELCPQPILTGCAKYLT